MNFEPYLNHLAQNRRCSDQTIKAYCSDLQMFNNFLDGRSLTGLSQVDHVVVTEYIEHMREQETTHVLIAKASLTRPSRVA